MSYLIKNFAQNLGKLYQGYKSFLFIYYLKNYIIKKEMRLISPDLYLHLPRWLFLITASLSRPLPIISLRINSRIFSEIEVKLENFVLSFFFCILIHLPFSDLVVPLSHFPWSFRCHWPSNHICSFQNPRLEFIWARFIKGSSVFFYYLLTYLGHQLPVSHFPVQRSYILLAEKTEMQ